MNQVDEIIEELFNYFNVGTISELAEKMNLKQSSVSSWKKRGSITAIKRKCRELGIYNDIFGDSTQIIKSNSGQIAQSVDGNQVFNPTNTSAPTQPPSQKTENIDEATFGLFKEAYKKAKENSDLKGLRILLMEY